MNKVLKGLVAVAATAAMAVAGFAGASTAMAVDGNTVNVTVPGAESNLNGHAYTAYQILSGTQATSGGALGDAEWGTGINDTAFLAALKADTTIGGYFTKVTDAKGFAEALSNTGNFPADGANTRLVAKIAMKNTKGAGTALTAPTTQLATGYYLIVDSTANSQTVYNPAVLAITSDITITDKTDVPTLEKKVQENKKSVTGEYGNGFNDVADYNIGDEVPFHLIGSVPDMSQYETYTYKFTDTFDKGFDAVGTSNVKVYLSNDKKLDLEGESMDTDITSYFSGTYGSIQYTAATEAQGETAGTKATLTVSTKDLKKAATYSKAQPQYVIVSYTAKLNANAKIGLPGNVNEAYLTYSNNPDQSGQGENQPTHDTPEDKVIVFTYGLDVTKVDSKNDKTKLKDAEFKLKNSDGKWATITDGKVTGWTTTENDGSVLKSDAEGNFKVTGLDDGTYTLVETKAPAGYNLPADGFSVTLKATTANDQTWDGTANTALIDLAVKVDQTNGTGDVDTGLGAITIKNTQGSSLPSTGGMGTVLLYVAGIAVFVLAGATLVMALRRRNA